LISVEKACPIQTTLDYIWKKWTLVLIRDLFYGRKRFKDFLGANPGLSGKVLSERLKELVKNGLVEKKVVSTDPVLIEYTLTEKGRSLNKVLYEVAMFGVKEYSCELEKRCCSNEAHDHLRDVLGIKD
jgi:DNA-binding HxlR family transcriptional regulator